VSLPKSIRLKNERIAESELILNEDGSVFHLRLQPAMVADTVIVVGDPNRVPKVSMYFDRIDFQVSSRELVTHTGVLNGKRISVISSGMGTDNVELLMTELDALVNVDLKTRQVNKKLKSLNIIRIGTSGCLQPDIPLDAILVSKAALGLDTLMAFYNWNHSNEAEILVSKVQRSIGLPFKPYFAEASSKLLSHFQAASHFEGLTITCPGFYAPQGREVRLKPAMTNYLDKLQKLDSSFGRFTNFEMETAGYYAMAKMLGHEMISLNALIANRAKQTFSSFPEKTVDNLIQTVLEKL
jgi:uridine phosphorylase